jgi:polyferredoxin
MKVYNDDDYNARKERAEPWVPKKNRRTAITLLVMFSGVTGVLLDTSVKAFFGGENVVGPLVAGMCASFALVTTLLWFALAYRSGEER